jgi:hypothetical protein
MRFRPAGKSHNTQRRRQFTVHRQIIQGGDEFTARQVARGAKNNYRAGLWAHARGQVFAERIASDIQDRGKVECKGSGASARSIAALCQAFFVPTHGARGKKNRHQQKHAKSLSENPVDV